MRARGLVVAGGQDRLAGRILRVGHMGDVGIEEMADAIEVMGGTLPEFGHAADGAGAARATRAAFEATTAGVR
jgi:aspartate aminotransferase-like enzyme